MKKLYNLYLTKHKLYSTMAPSGSVYIDYINETNISVGITTKEKYVLSFGGSWKIGE